MNNFGGINHAGDARRAHLALVESGSGTGRGSTQSLREASAALGNDPVLRTSQVTNVRAARTGFAPTAGEAPRTRHENGVRAVAKLYDNFDDALHPMVLASGVAGENAGAVAAAIRSNPQLLAQAERAFQRARINLV